MPQPHTVVIPFGVPEEGRGLGIGLAALVHAFTRVDGEGIAIAQLHAKKKDEPADAKPSPVEAFVPPAAWHDLAQRGDAPQLVHVVVTGAIEPPLAGPGAIQLLAFDPRDGQTRARVDAPLDASHAGASLVGAIEQLWSRLGGEIGALGGLRDLEWEPLESVLRAERCALHDPLRGGPHDRLAAMLHLGRAIGDAPEARYPVERLAALALETASGPALDAKLAQAAARALERAAEDSPGHVELVEALAALLLRLGQARDAERLLNAAIATQPPRARLFMLLAQSLRAQGLVEAALATVADAQSKVGVEPGLCTERGAILAARGDLEGARAAWRVALSRDAVHPGAYLALSSLALRTRDAEEAQRLVDAALGAPRALPDVLRRAVQLVLATEADGLPRASRVAQLCARILEGTPGDLGAALALARSQVALGDTEAGRARLREIVRVAPATAAAAEAQAVLAVLDDPQLESEIAALRRSITEGAGETLADVSARARRLGTLRGFWPAWMTAALADRKRGASGPARAALAAALDLAPGTSVAHVELAELLLEAGEPSAARDHARQALSLEGDTPRTLRALARALDRLGETPDARAAATRAAAMDPQDEEGRALADRLHRPSQAPSWTDRLRETWNSWTRRTR